MKKKRLRVNGVEQSCEGVTDLAVLVQKLAAGEADGIAVAVNGEIVPRGQWREREVQDGDDIEIVRAVQGG